MGHIRLATIIEQSRAVPVRLVDPSVQVRREDHAPVLTLSDEQEVVEVCFGEPEGLDRFVARLLSTCGATPGHDGG